MKGTAKGRGGSSWWGFKHVTDHRMNIQRLKIRSYRRGEAALRDYPQAEFQSGVESVPPPPCSESAIGWASGLLFRCSLHNLFRVANVLFGRNRGPRWQSQNNGEPVRLI